MPRRRLRVYQHLTLDSVVHDDTRVAAAIVDREGQRHQVVFHFKEARIAADHAWSMRQWQEQGRALTYVQGQDGRGALIDDEAAFRRAFGESPSLS